MDIRTIQSKEFALAARAYRQARQQAAAAKMAGASLTRRQFLKTAGAAVLGSTLIPSLLQTGTVAASGPGTPVPIPGGTPVLGGGFHLFGPGIIDPDDAEPASITDFNGSVGIAFISGMVTRTNTVTHEVRSLPFLSADMRFMKGVFRGQDGKIHNGAFAFIWIDVFEPGPGSGVTQIHDLNPTAFPPTSLFWTIAIPGGGIDVNLGKGSAVVQASNVPVIDWGNIPNALFFGLSPVAAQTSFKIVWSGVTDRLNINNTDPVYGGFGGEFVRNSAQMEWTATAGDYQFASDPLATSSSSFSEIGHERNGMFF